MLAEIRKAAERVPFHPFSIELAGGQQVPVPHPDHLFIGRFFVVVQDDHGHIDVLANRHIARLRWQEREQSA